MTVRVPSTPSPCELIKSPTIITEVTSPIQFEETKTASMQQPRKDVIGNYKIGKVLGKGAYGQVKLGIHLLTGRTVAIKII